ncbi:DUF922 domain-containing protein [Mucilaginibacter terrae]|uniref:Secreted Zn-dependent protease n=1 Tax=Mucilaginibacter terrae TaxID=1955052 RepID=A0ABU3GW29_9SPHI|nr:DUF922 domain-containing protein [Mucilaginibacter terrae]MDT3403973.1 putative secreted Zn-dependent protease [Mucilaginibacter terrae]
MQNYLTLMMLKYVKLICVFVLFILSTGAVKAQGYRQLTADDFTGQVPAGSGFYVAHTSCNVTMRYNVQSYRSNYRLTFYIPLVFNPERSWINRKMIRNDEMMDEVLHHEQGHYVIAFLMQQELIRELNAFHYTGDYQRQANNIFNRIDEKYRRMNAAYDSETMHMQDRKQQANWTAYLDRQLQESNRLVMNN